MTDYKYQPPGIKYVFRIVDVGGQRSERRKWLQLFDELSISISIKPVFCIVNGLFASFPSLLRIDSLAFNPLLSFLFYLWVGEGQHVGKGIQKLVLFLTNTSQHK